MPILLLAIVRAIGGQPASTYVGNANSYFLEVEVSTKSMLVEFLAFGEEIILGRNLLNELVIKLNELARKLTLRQTTPNEVILSLTSIKINL